MKKYTSIAVVMMFLLLVVSSINPVQAEENTGSITVKSVESGRVVELYKIFDLTYNGSRVSYTIDANWIAFFQGGRGFVSFRE